MTRARLYVLVDALEEDLRTFLKSWVVERVGTESGLDPYTDEARARLLNDPSADGEEDDLVDYLYLQEAVSLLNRHRALLPTDLAEAVRRNTPRLDSLSPIRNRVMHGRPLKTEDPDTSVQAGNDLLAAGVDWPNLREVLNHLNADPDWEPAYFVRLPLRERVLHNLPLPDFDETGLVGRGNEARTLLRHLLSRREHVLTVVGEGGVGKTALAVKVLYDLIDHSECPYEAVLWTSLKTEALTAEGIKALATAARDIVGMVRALAYPLDPEFQGSVEELGTVLEGATVLLVVDNLETADSNEIVRLYDAMPDTTQFLFTSRVGLGQLERRVQLGGLDARDASNLFRRYARIRGLTHLATLDDRQVASIATALRQNPLAIRWYLLSIESGHQPDLALQNQDELLEFCVRSVFDALSESARRLLLDVFALGRSVSFSELAVLAGEGLDELRAGLHELQRSSLIETTVDAGSRVSQIFALTTSASQFIARIAPPEEVRAAEIRDRDRQFRARTELRQRDAASEALAPTTVHLRSQQDAPVADLLTEALELSRVHDETWRDKVATAGKLAPMYSEVPRVAAFIESSRGHVDQATSLYQQALGLANDDARGIVAYFYAGHLTRTAHRPEDALPLAEEAHEKLKTDRATLQFGTTLLYLERFDEAEEIFRSVYASASGITRLIALTQVVSTARRRAEWIATHDHNPLLAFRAAAAGVEAGLAELRSGIRDRKLTETVVKALSDALLHAKSIQIIPTDVEDQLIKMIRAVRLNERYWERSEAWPYCSAHLSTLLSRSDLPRGITLLSGADDVRTSDGVGSHYFGSIVRFFPHRGYGFVRGDGLEILEVFFRAKGLVSRFDRLLCIKGTRVSFLLSESDGRLFATALEFADDERERILARPRTGVVTAKHDSFLFVEDDATRASVFVGVVSLARGLAWKDVREGSRLSFLVELAARGPRAVRGTVERALDRPPDRRRR